MNDILVMLCGLKNSNVFYAVKQSTSKLKLDTPVIYLQEGGSTEPINPSGYTPAILGKAVLGRTKLGVTNLAGRLSAPIIYLEEE